MKNFCRVKQIRIDTSEEKSIRIGQTLTRERGGRTRDQSVLTLRDTRNAFGQQNNYPKEVGALRRMRHLANTSNRITISLVIF